MFLTAYGYRELNRSIPDCGTSFTWATKAFGPYVGWMCGWGAILATVIVLSNLAGVAVSFFSLFIARLTGADGIADLASNPVVNVLTCVAFIAICTFVAYRGITTSEHVQAVPCSCRYRCSSCCCSWWTRSVGRSARTTTPRASTGREGYYPGLRAELRAALGSGDDYATPGKPQIDWDDPAARKQLIDSRAHDGFAVLALLEGRDRDELGEPVAQAGALLATVLGQDLAAGEDGVFRTRASSRWTCWSTSTPTRCTWAS